MALNSEDRAYLYQVFGNDEHEVREGIVTKSGNVRWWVYLQKPAIIRHLDYRFFGEWSDEYHSHRDHKGYSEVYCRLSIHDMHRENNGSGVASSNPEYVGKSAATDAFKRAASSWGMGLYLQTAPQIWTAHDFGKYPNLDYDKQRTRKNEALQKVFAWLGSLRKGETIPENTVVPKAATPSSPPSQRQEQSDKPSGGEVTNRRTKVITAFAGVMSSTEVMTIANKLNIDWENTKSGVIIQAIKESK